MTQHEPRFEVRRYQGIGGAWRAWCNHCSWVSQPMYSRDIAQTAGEQHEKRHDR